MEIEYPDFSLIFDEEIMDLIYGKSYSPTDALIAQLILELRKLRKAVDEKQENTK